MTTRVLSSAFLSLFMSVSSYGASLPDAPIEIRLNRLAILLKQFEAVKAGDSMVAGALVKGGMTYILKWTRSTDNANPFKEERSWDRLVEVATDSLKEELPQGLRPESAKLLGIARYQVGRPTSLPYWVWVVEFKVENESPVAGTGYNPTLFVPISLEGNSLVQVERR